MKNYHQNLNLVIIFYILVESIHSKFLSEMVIYSLQALMLNNCRVHYAGVPIYMFHQMFPSYIFSLVESIHSKSLGETVAALACLC